MRKLINKNIICYVLTLVIMVGYITNKHIIPQFNSLMDKKAAVEKSLQDLEQAKNNLRQQQPPIKLKKYQ